MPSTFSPITAFSPSPMNCETNPSPLTFVPTPGVSDMETNEIPLTLPSVSIPTIRLISPPYPLPTELTQHPMIPPSFIMAKTVSPLSSVYSLTSSPSGNMLSTALFCSFTTFSAITFSVSIFTTDKSSAIPVHIAASITTIRTVYAVLPSAGAFSALGSLFSFLRGAFFSFFSFGFFSFFG